MKPIVIIGTGLAGYGLAREFRKLNEHQPLLMISRDDGRAYSKPLLSTALSKHKTAAELSSADADEMAAQLNAEIRSWTEVAAIDAHAHTLHIGDEVIHYDKLVLAVGARPRRPEIQGDSECLLSVNNLGDYQHFREQLLSGKEHVAILGGGLIGCEFANDLANAGHPVSIIDRHAQPLGALLPPLIAERLAAALQAIGVQWLGETRATRINKEASGYTLALDNGQTLNCDVVLSAIGLQACTELASHAGLATGRGIITDRFLQSSAADIYALGDCAEVAGHLLPFVMPLMIGTRALAQTLNGTATAVSYPAMPVTVKTPAYPISVLPPPPGIDGKWEIELEADAARAMFVDDADNLRGFVLAGTAAPQARQLARELPGLMDG